MSSSSRSGSAGDRDKPPPTKGVAKALAFRSSKKQPSTSRSVDYVASKLRSTKLLSRATPVFQEEAPHEEISTAILKNARKTGILSLASRNLTSVPPKVWRINELEEKEKATAVSVSMDSPSDDKWWEFVDLQKLIVANNVITEIPREIATLVSLQAFDAHDNRINLVAKEIGTLDKLQRVDLSINRIATLPDELFNLKRLVDLKLGHNQLEEISKEISRLSCLRHLDLSHNKLTSLPGDMGFLSFLTQLNISNNRIRELPPDFGGLTALRVFDASDNSLTNLSNCINQMRHLEILLLQKNKLKEIPQLDECSSLKELFMQNNAIRVLDSKLFRMTKVQLLDFRYNKIETLEIERCDLEYVDRLYLNNNNITSIPDDLPTLPSLKQVTLESNPLRGIRPDILQRGTIEIIKYLKGRQRLSISDPTQIKLPSKSETSSITSSEVIANVRDKSTVEDLGIDVHRLKNTRALNLVSRNIKVFDEKVFADAKEAKVTIIDVSKNMLTQFPTSFEDVCQFLTELKLDFNRFTQFPAYIGTSCSQLQYLSFQNNLLTQLPLEFANLKNLREINFGYNKFTEIPSCLYELPALEIVIAPDNKITDIQMAGLEKLRRLAVLDLRNNDIRHAPPELGLLTQLRSLNIEGNAFRVPGHAVLSQGSDAVLNFLRNKVTQKQ